MKESEDPESTRDFRTISGRVSEVRERVSKSGFERVDALRVRVFTHRSSMQSLGHVDFGQSLVMCPEVPQKRQSLLSRWHCCSCRVSLLSFPSFEESQEWWTSSVRKLSPCPG